MLQLKFYHDKPFPSQNAKILSHGNFAIIIAIVSSSDYPLEGICAKNINVIYT